jgi:ketosteroid isomerase-like protein
MKRLILAAALCGVLIFLTLACGQKPADIVMAYQEAVNAGDVDKVMSLYSDQPRFSVPGLFDLQGPEALRGLAHYDRMLNTTLEFSGLEARGDTVFCRAKETNDWIETADIGEFYYQAVIVVRRGRIETIEATFTPETDRAFRRVMVPLTEWAKAERPDQLAEMMPQGEFLYNAGNAKKNLSLLRDFKQNMHRQAIRPNWRKLGE